MSCGVEFGTNERLLNAVQKTFVNTDEEVTLRCEEKKRMISPKAKSDEPLKDWIVSTAASYVCRSIKELENLVDFDVKLQCRFGSLCATKTSTPSIQAKRSLKFSPKFTSCVNDLGPQYQGETQEFFVYSFGEEETQIKHRLCFSKNKNGVLNLEESYVLEETLVRVQVISRVMHQPDLRVVLEKQTPHNDDENDASLVKLIIWCLDNKDKVDGRSVNVPKGFTLYCIRHKKRIRHIVDGKYVDLTVVKSWNHENNGFANSKEVEYGFSVEKQLSEDEVKMFLKKAWEIGQGFQPIN